MWLLCLTVVSLGLGVVSLLFGCVVMLLRNRLLTVVWSMLGGALVLGEVFVVVVVGSGSWVGPAGVVCVLRSTTGSLVSLGTCIAGIPMCL